MKKLKMMVCGLILAAFFLAGPLSGSAQAFEIFGIELFTKADLDQNSDGVPDIGEQGPPGIQGDPGEPVMLQVADGYIQWKLASFETWTNLIAVADLQGEAGIPGAPGDPGEPVLLQVSESFIQWKYMSDVLWTNLIAVADLTGPMGPEGPIGLPGEPQDLTGLQTLVSNDFHNLGGTETDPLSLKPADIGVTVQPALSATLSTDLTYSGRTDTGTAGETVAFGQPLYFKVSDGRWWKSVGGAAAGALPCEAIAVSAGDASDSITILLNGKIRNDAWNWTITDARKLLYVSYTTAGVITEDVDSIPCETYTQVIGTIRNADQIYFNPQIAHIRTTTCP